MQAFCCFFLIFTNYFLLHGFYPNSNHTRRNQLSYKQKQQGYHWMSFAVAQLPAAS